MDAACVLPLPAHIHGIGDTADAEMLFTLFCLKVSLCYTLSLSPWIPADALNSPAVTGNVQLGFLWKTLQPARALGNKLVCSGNAAAPLSSDLAQSKPCTVLGLSQVPKEVTKQWTS